MLRTGILCVAITLMLACSRPADVRKQAQAFLDEYHETYKALQYEASEAEWKANTMIIEGDTTISAAAQRAKQKLAEFTGSTEVIEKARHLLAQKERLDPLQVRQLEKILYMAAANPQTVPELVKEKIKLETEQVKKLFGFDFKIDGRSVSTNDIDDILKKETNPAERLKAWEASKEVGKPLRQGLIRLRDLRNQTVQALGYSDFFTYQVSDYGMTTDEMLALLQQLNEEVRPLYRELHTYVRYELARRYGLRSVPEFIPAHWLPNRWGQDWSALVNVKGLDLDSALRDKSAEWVVKQGERFYVSLGFQPLPPSFWEKSSLYPLPPDATYKKNNHASAWHIDLDRDVRCLMSVVPNTEWYETVHHELGHIYYFLEYSNPEVPLVLRDGANRAFHEGLGSLMGLAAMQKPFLAHIGLLASDGPSDDQRALLKEALNYIVFIPWSAGVMTRFEYELYAGNLPEDKINLRWWELKALYQGIAPPSPRDESYCDPASKTHITDDPAQYYDYAISYVILFQLHDYIARNILHQDPHATNYYGNKQVGEFLRRIMRPGASVDWRKLLKEATSEGLTARPMMEYFQPLMAYLQKANRGRKHTLPDL